MASFERMSYYTGVLEVEQVDNGLNKMQINTPCQEATIPYLKHINHTNT